MTMNDLIEDLHQDERELLRRARRREKLVEFGVALAIVGVAALFLWGMLR